jgi:hypothetical protein
MTRAEKDFSLSEAALYERDLHVAITIAWYEARPRGFKLDGVLRPYAFGSGFATSVEDNEKYADLEHVAATCALVVCSQPWELRGIKKVMDTQSIGLSPKHEGDPVCAWWYPLGSPSLLGIHYWELGNRVVELKRLSKFDRPPALQFGRFGAHSKARQGATRGHGG